MSNQSTHQTHIKPIDWQLELDRDVTERGRHLCHYCTNWHIEPIDWQIELGHGVVEISRGRRLCQCRTNFLHVELDEGITAFYMDANFATRPVNMLNQHQTNWLAIRIRSGRHWTWMPLLTKSNQSTRRTNQLASRIRPGRHWISAGRHLCHCPNHRHFESIDWHVELD